MTVQSIALAFFAMLLGRYIWKFLRRRHILLHTYMAFVGIIVRVKQWFEQFEDKNAIKFYDIILRDPQHRSHPEFLPRHLPKSSTKAVKLLQNLLQKRPAAWYIIMRLRIGGKVIRLALIDSHFESLIENISVERVIAGIFGGSNIVHAQFGNLDVTSEVKEWGVGSQTNIARLFFRPEFLSMFSPDAEAQQLVCFNSHGQVTDCIDAWCQNSGQIPENHLSSVRFLTD